MDGHNNIALITNFRNVWSSCGDRISWHYTGTGSTHTDVTRGGKRGYVGYLLHGYKSLRRFYN